MIWAISGDSQEALEARVQDGLAQADILLTSGGVSMGELDLVKPLLEHAGTVHFGRVRMKPGKPVTFATADVEGGRRLVFGLPGNPVSSLVTFYLFVVPALRKMAGWREPRNFSRFRRGWPSPCPWTLSDRSITAPRSTGTQNSIPSLPAAPEARQAAAF